MPPPPPGQGYVSSPAPSTGTALGYAQPSSAVLRMDWDDEELSTQIYDRPEEVQVGDNNPYGAYEDPRAGYASQQQYDPQNEVATYAPATYPAAAPSAFDPAPQQAAQSPGTSRAAQVTQPIVTHSGSPEKNRGRMFAGLAVAAVAVLCVIIYVFLAKTEPGVVQLTTHPLDAQVLFDGKPVGSSSPFIVTNVAPNENHLIEVKKAGYTSWSQEVQVQPGQTLQLPVGLELALGGSTAGVASAEGTPVQTGAFSLETVPAGAKVFLDGQELGGVTPLRVGNLAPRHYDVRVRLDGFRETTIPVEIRGGVDQSLSRVVLDALQVRARITSEPPNAQVELSRGDDRRPVGKTPVDVTLDNNGTPWVLSVSKSGFEDYRETLNTQSGSAELAVRAVLMRSAGGASEARPSPTVPRPRPASAGGGGSSTASAPSGSGTGTLRLNSRPWAQVFVDGKAIGNTPQMNISLSAGQHKITLVNPEFRLRKNLTVTIKAGEVQTQIISLQ